MYPQTAYRWFREGMLPVPAERVGPRTIHVNVEANAAPGAVAGIGLYARVSCDDRKADLEFESEIGSAVSGGRSTVKRLLAAPNVTAVVVEHKDRLGG